MKTVQIGKVNFGEGKPKICIPIMGSTFVELEKEIEALKELPFDMIEWRMDFFKDIFNSNKKREAVNMIRKRLNDTVLLATFRTSKEGGQTYICKEDYVLLYKEIIDLKLVDIIDVELFTGEKEVKEILDYAHKHNVYVIMSNHDFKKTLTYEQIIDRLCNMQEYDADICKIALMPQNKEDVLTLLKATKDMTEKYADRPIVSMSMSKKGLISRIAGEVFGSCLTFGSAYKASAPGQINARELDTILEIIHHSI